MKDTIPMGPPLPQKVESGLPEWVKFTIAFNCGALVMICIVFFLLST